MDNENNFLNHIEVNKNFGIQTNFLQLLQIINAIPKKWKEDIKNIENMEELIDIVQIYEENVSITNLTSKKVYLLIINTLFKIIISDLLTDHQLN